MEKPTFCPDGVRDLMLKCWLEVSADGTPDFEKKSIDVLKYNTLFVLSNTITTNYSIKCFCEATVGCSDYSIYYSTAGWTGKDKHVVL